MLFAPFLSAVLVRNGHLECVKLLLPYTETCLDAVVQSRVWKFRSLQLFRGNCLFYRVNGVGIICGVGISMLHWRNQRASSSNQNHIVCGTGGLENCVLVIVKYHRIASQKLCFQVDMKIPLAACTHIFDCMEHERFHGSDIICDRSTNTSERPHQRDD